MGISVAYEMCANRQGDSTLLCSCVAGAHGELFIIIGNYECDDTRITTQTVTGSPVSMGFDYSSVDVVF